MEKNHTEILPSNFVFFFPLLDLYGSHTHIKATNITKTEATNLDILIMIIFAALHHKVINCNWSTLPVMESSL